MKDNRTDTEQAVEGHYGDPRTRIYAALEATGVDLDRLDVDTLAAFDEFHVRGRESTAELAELAKIGAGEKVLDVGCGIGGSARYLARHRGCEVTGVDLSAAYCELASDLTARVGLGDQVNFRQSSALELPFSDDSFDVVWTEHAQMNIADKRGFFAEMTRVLRPGGRLAFHDVFAGDGGELEFPTPWATEPSESFLLEVAALRDLIGDLGLSIMEWRDCSAVSTEFFRGLLERLASSGPPPLGVHLMMGERAPEKIRNLHGGLASGALVTIEAVAA